MKLTDLETRILFDIALSHPYSIDEVKKVYKRCKSFDETIKILDEATQHHLPWDITCTKRGF